MFFGFIAALLFAPSDIDAKPLPQYSIVSTKLDQHVIKRQLLDVNLADDYADESSLAQNFADNNSPVEESDMHFSTVSYIGDTSSDQQESPIIASLENGSADSSTIGDLDPSITESLNASIDDCKSRDGPVGKRDLDAFRRPEACPINHLSKPNSDPLPWARPKIKPQTETKENPCPARRAMLATQVKVPEKSKHVSCGGPAVGKTALYPIHVLNCVPGKPDGTICLLE